MDVTRKILGMRSSLPRPFSCLCPWLYLIGPDCFKRRFKGFRVGLIHPRLGDQSLFYPMYLQQTDISCSNCLSTCFRVCRVLGPDSFVSLDRSKKSPPALFSSLTTSLPCPALPLPCLTWSACLALPCPSPLVLCCFALLFCPPCALPCPAFALLCYCPDLPSIALTCCCAAALPWPALRCSALPCLP